MARCFMRAILVQERKGHEMKKVFLLLAIAAMPAMLTACARTCETEPIVEENHKLIVPPHFGQMPK